MFKDCINEVQRFEYKKSKKLQKENDDWLRVNNPDFYRIQRLGSYSDVFEAICKNIEIPTCETRFLHFIDHRYIFDTTRGYRFENITPDYSIIIDNGLESMKYKCEDITNDFCVDYNRIIDSLIKLVKRIAIHEKELGTEFGYLRQVFFMKMISKPTSDFAEALQRILFFDQIYWQMGQRLMGLGHLDSMLYPIYDRCIKNGTLTRDEALLIIQDFIRSLHQYCWLKSNMLLGDTGQIIILGSSCNELTYLFLEAVRTINLPDPKLLLRVSSSTPRQLLEVALLCMKSGCGSPILANDDIIIPRLVDFGVPCEDAHRYGVAACWEPLIPGKSISPNNMKSITYPKAMQRVWESEQLTTYDTLEKWIEAFYKGVEAEIDWIISVISEKRFQYNPYLSLLTHNCRETKKDVSYGGAAYNSYGLTTVGLSNTVNTIFNLKELVYDKKEYTLEEVRDILFSDFEGNEELRERLNNNKIHYGQDKPEVLELAKKILQHTSEYVSGFRNYMGGRLKIGASSPSYIDAAEGVLASFDGRKTGDPFAVHISSEKNNGYTEIVNFAAQLDYNDNRFNGNVVDLMVSPSFIEDNFDKMVSFLKASIKRGFFELQMNVVSSKMLIEAKKNPEKYPSLIVRVWGFSAYFVQLPESYQDVLIERTLENEKGESTL